MMDEITQAAVKHLYDYDPSTGALLWRQRPDPRSKRKAGDVAGSLRTNGRWTVTVSGQSFPRYRVVWLYHKGSMPSGELDHINRDPSDDRIENLREACRSEQLANRGAMGHNTSGYRGVYFDPRKKRWAARISIYGNRKRLGTFASPEEAFAVVDAAGREAYGEFWCAA